MTGGPQHVNGMQQKGGGARPDRAGALSKYATRMQSWMQSSRVRHANGANGMLTSTRFSYTARASGQRRGDEQV